MELSSDSEKELLIETQPLGWSPLEDKYSDSRSEILEDASGSLDLWQTDQTHQLCQDWMPADESDARRAARRKLFIAGALTLVFMIGEVIGGYAAHSLAIMTDAAHLLTDFGSILISLFSLWISSRPMTQTMTFGWHRAEILGMLLSMVSIWAVTAALVVSAAQRISDGNYDIDSRIMLITSGCAVGANILMVVILHQSGASHGHGHGVSTSKPQGNGDRHSHGHGHGHSHGVSTSKPQGNGERHSHGNASVRAAFIHVVGDLLQSVGVLLAATVIHFWPEYKVADPICTFLFSVLVLGTTLPITKDVLRILMQGAPQDTSFSAVRESLLSVGGVLDVHSLHMWSLNTSHALLSVHVVAEKDADSQIVLTKTTKLLRSEFSFHSVTIQVESFRPESRTDEAGN